MLLTLQQAVFISPKPNYRKYRLNPNELNMKKILIANRGEIALRIMRSAHEMGIKTVAIFSEADRNTRYVRYSDEAVCIGAPPSSQSYLRGDKIIEICKNLNVDAIHPGYGFLSENAEFAHLVNASGITFIGPSPEAMRIMGDKLSAKAAVKKYNIPLVPGTDKALDNLMEAKRIAVEIGFPVLIKASAGGGGKGMRVVENIEDFEEQMNRAVSEAKSAFGDGAVFIEKYLAAPRHIEIQILADTHGNIVHLFERECSIQRRHQKVVEEAPSAVLSEKIRNEMGQCAVNVAKACNYVGAGTVEFLLDENNNFYFLEMNTRLQVEHPVTEMITGIDLVKEQIRVARGEKLAFTQNDLKIRGHAIEVRVYAEDPYNNFMPNVGKLVHYHAPKGIGVRVDDGYEQGMEIPIYYDSMIAKLITYGKDRPETIERMKRAIKDYKITGFETTLPFCDFVMRHEAFISGKYSTKFVDNYFKPEYLNNPNDYSDIAAIMAARYFEDKKQTTTTICNNNTSVSNWKRNRIN